MSDVVRPAAGSDILPDLSVQSFAACEVGKDVRLIGAAVDGDSIYLVLAGKLHLALPAVSLVAPAGSLVLVPAGLQPSVASSAQPLSEYVATRERLAQRGGLMIFDAAQGRAGALRMLVGRVRGDLFARLSGPGRPDKPIVLDLKNSQLARVAYATLRDELDRPRPGLPVLAATLMKACLLLFLRGLQDPRSVALPSAAGQRIAAVAAAIQARSADNYSTETLAALAGMSRATFIRHFYRHVGVTPMHFVQRTRLRDAASLLRTTSLPIKQVASDAGFISRSHFTRAFQAHFGLDPSTFRDEAQGREADSDDVLLPIPLS